MVSRLLLLIALIHFGISGAKADSVPQSKETIQAWWSATSEEEMTIEGDLIEVHLRSKEIAYLVPIGFYHRGRNSIWHALLVRPAQQEVREVVEPVRRDIEVHDFDHDGVSEVVAVSLGSGQGTTIGVKSIVQFDEWTPIVLHQTKVEGNEGAYGVNSYRFLSKSASWKFTDLNGDGTSDLVEEIMVQQGRNNRPPIISRTRHKFIFDGKSFVKYVHYIRSARKARHG